MYNGLAAWHYKHRTYCENAEFFAANGFEAVSMLGLHMKRVLQDPAQAEEMACIFKKHGIPLTIHYKLPNSHSAEDVDHFHEVITRFGDWQKTHGLIHILSFDVPNAVRENLAQYVDFVLETVNLLVKNHGISLNEETMIHSDQGVHYTSVKFIQLVKDSHLRQSMSRRGNCWDNAPQESFFGHMKDEIGRYVKEASSFEELRMIINDYMDYYNSERYQYDLAKLSPNEYLEYYKTGIYPLKKIAEEDEKTIKKFQMARENLKKLEEERNQAAASME